MLLREKSKQLTNVSVVTLKRQDRKYEVAVYPNKIYEFRHNPSASLNSIIHSDVIYRNISSGDVCSEQDLELLRGMIGEDVLDRSDLIKYIVINGYEQKAHETYVYELDSIERQLVDLVQSKVTYNGSYISTQNLLEFIRKVWNIKNTDPKRQVSGIIKKLEEIGFERVSFKVKVENLDINDIFSYMCTDKQDLDYDEKIGLLLAKGISFIDGMYVVKSDALPGFINYCESKQLRYVVSKNEEVEEEEIC